MDLKDSIREKLYNNHLSNNWLIYRLSLTGKSVSKSELSRFLKGLKQGPKADDIIETSYRILLDYESRMNV